MKPIRLARQAIHQSSWVNLFLDKVRMPGGRVIEDFHVLDYERQGVGAIIENSQGEILMIQAYRYPTDSIEWEIPAGGVEPGESALKAAQREVFEETGYQVDQLTEIYAFYPSSGNSNQMFHIVKGRAGARTGNIDVNEVKSIAWRSAPEIQWMIKNKELVNGLTLTALLLHFMELK
jgi:8-oxo-dGTP pyrophosphatase MutT (NUDIX family)